MTAEDKFFDHHREILAAKMEMENQEKAQQFNDNSENIRRDTEGGIIDDLKFAKEFDKNVRELNHYHPYHGDLVVKKEGKFDVMELGSINVRQANEHLLVFRKVPCHIWIAGLCVIIASLYLIYHLALGKYGVLFQGYREGYWW